MKEAKEILEHIQGTSEAGASEAVPESAAPESATIVETSKASAKVIQISDSPTTISPPLSPSNESDHDDIPLGQRMKMLPKPSPKPFEPKYPDILQSIGEMSQRRVDICNKLPADHPFQPPVIKPLNMIPANNPQPSQTTLQEEQSSATAEGSEDPEEPNTYDLPQCDSPSNLFSLERHLGGEITKTTQKATKSVPKKIDLVNQQPPQPSHQTTPEPSCTQIQTPTAIQTQTHTFTKQMIIPEPVVDTMVPESVLVTESEPSLSISVSQPTQNLPLTTNDHPSSPSSPSIQILEQPPTNLLESEYIEAELLQISKDMQKLVHLRRAPTLSISYEDQWATLKTRASDLLNAVSKKCIRIQAAAVKHYFTAVHSAEEAQAPLLYLANAPFFPESD